MDQLEPQQNPQNTPKRTIGPELITQNYRRDTTAAIGLYLSIVLVLFVLGSLISRNVSEFEGANQQRLETQAVNHVILINKRVRQIEESLGTFEEMVIGTPNGYTERQTQAPIRLIQTASEVPYVKRLAVLNALGNVVYQTGPLQIVFQTQDWLSVLNPISPLFSTRIFMSPVARDLSDGGQVMTVGLPILNSQGLFEGAVIAEIDPIGLWSAVTQQTVDDTSNRVWVRTDGLTIQQTLHTLESLPNTTISQILTSQEPVGSPTSPTYLTLDWPDLFPDGSHKVSSAYSEFYPFAVIFIEPMSATTNQRHVGYGGLFVLFLMASVYTGLHVFWRRKQYQSMLSLYTQADLSKRLYRTLTDDYPIPVIILSPQGIIQQNNAIARAVLTEQITPGISILKAWDADHANDLSEALLHVKDRMREQRFQFIRRNTQYEATLVPIESRLQGLSTILMYVVDLEEDTKVEAERKGLLDEIENLKSTSTTFVQMLSDELTVSLQETQTRLSGLKEVQPNSGFISEIQTRLETALTRIRNIETLFTPLDKQYSRQNTEVDLKEAVEKICFETYHQYSDKAVDVDIFVDTSVPGLLIIDFNTFETLMTNLLRHCMDQEEKSYIGIWLYCDTAYPNILSLDISVNGPQIFPLNIFDILPSLSVPTTLPKTVKSFGLSLTTAARALLHLNGTFPTRNMNNDGKSLALDIPISPTRSAQAETRSHDLADINVIVLTKNSIRAAKLAHELDSYSAIVSQCDDVASALEILGQFKQSHIKASQLALIADETLFANLYLKKQADLADVYIDAVAAGPTDVDAVVGALWTHFNTRVSYPDHEDTNRKEAAQTHSDVRQLFNAPLPNLPDDAPQLLLAMENPVSRKHIIGLTNKLGYRTQPIEDGHALLAAVRSGKYVAVILDADMAPVSALELTHAIRSLSPPLNDLPTFITSGHSSVDYQRMAKQAGCSDIIFRPVSVDTLGASLSKHLNTSLRDRVLLNESDLIRSERDLGTAFMKDLVNSVISDGNIRVEEMNAALAAGDFSAISEQATQLIGTSDTIAATALREICYMIIQACNEQNFKAVQSSVSDLMIIQEETAHLLSQRFQLSPERI